MSRIISKSPSYRKGKKFNVKGSIAVTSRNIRQVKRKGEIVNKEHRVYVKIRGRWTFQTSKRVNKKQTIERTLQEYKSLPAENKTFNQRVIQKIQLTGFNYVETNYQTGDKKYRQLRVWGDVVLLKDKGDVETIGVNIEGYSNKQITYKEDLGRYEEYTRDAMIEQAKANILAKFRTQNKKYAEKFNKTKKYKLQLDVIVRKVTYIHYAKIS